MVESELPFSSFIRYLESKKTVDDRALNGQVWARLAAELPPGTSSKPVDILEVGAGIGTMVERIEARGLCQYARYTLLDVDATNIAYAAEKLPDWARRAGFTVRAADAEIHLSRPNQHLTLKLVAGGIDQYLPAASAAGKWDLLIAHAFLDLVPLESAVPLLRSALRPGGLLFCTINFDGVTLFEPVPDLAFEDHLMALYHQTMDDRIIAGEASGDSRTGRHLFEVFARQQVDILAAGSSDWVVFPGPDGYPADEAYFLHFIIHTIQQALSGHASLDQSRLADWAAQRHAQIEGHGLRFIAHQLDFLGRKSP